MDVAGHTKMPLLKVIRAKCVFCCDGHVGEVRQCGITECPNWPYRMGKNPFRTGRPLDGKMARQMRAKQASFPGEKA